MTYAMKGIIKDIARLAVYLLIVGYLAYVVFYQSLYEPMKRNYEECGHITLCLETK